METLRIVSAANRFILKDGDELIVPSVRHWDSLMTHIVMVLADRLTDDPGEQGFVDQFGEFHTREAAWVIAQAAEQVVRRVGGDEGKLYSENLY